MKKTKRPHFRSDRQPPERGGGRDLIAASISGKYDFGDLRSDLQRKLSHIGFGTRPEAARE